MVNLLNKNGQAKTDGKKLDVMDYMWNEMKITVRCNKVPIYGSYIQTLIDSKIPATLANNYLTIDGVTPAINALKGAKKDGADLKRTKHARPSPDEQKYSSSTDDTPEASPIRAP